MAAASQLDTACRLGRATLPPPGYCRRREFEPDRLPIHLPAAGRRRHEQSRRLDRDGALVTSPADGDRFA